MPEAPTFDEELAAAAPAVLDQINSAFADSVLLVARHVGGAPAATGARVVAIDPAGFELALDGPPGRRRIAFDARLADMDAVPTQFLTLVRRARERSGEPGETSAEALLKQMSTIRTFLTSVSAVEVVHPHLRRITFAGGDLATFTPLGPDTFLYVLLPPPGRDTLTIDQSFTWEQHGRMPEEERPVGAYYTLRRWRPEAAELQMLFVLHDPAGPASEWAARAEPGDPVALWGPRESWAPPAGTDWYLLVADDTGLPAVARILETLPDGPPVHVVAEVADAAEHQDLPDRPNTEVHWIHRDGRAPGTVAERTEAAVRALDLPPGDGYVWGGGESRSLTAVRRYVRREVGLPRERVSLVAYWRHARSPVESDED
jgi:NADPH-dependent ferric siderophore reductase